ncbi:MAG: hypothetical protein F6K11_06430 [Leptolyngbya sp. SIO3F4]|nr:hypothetical protein [Leptolyngbya sp. SIO3F4]
MVIGVQLTYPVLAHSGEFHGQPAETATPDDSNPDNSEIESETPASSTQSETTDVTAVETVVSQPAPLPGLPAGLGESLFTILIGFPWLLIALRAKLYP